MRPLRALTVTVGALAALALPVTAGGTTGPSVLSLRPAVAPPAAACTSRVPGDVNGDGFAEVAVGEPGNQGSRGAIHLFYGQRAGLVFDAAGTARNDQYFNQATVGVPGLAEADDRFGTDSVLADFNADGCADLAVGSPGEDAGSGRLTVLYGSRTGVTTDRAQSFTLPGLFGSAAVGSEPGLGDTLAAGDLNHDGVDDLVAGVLGLDVGSRTSAGGVAVVYGSASGLNRGGDRAVLLTRDTTGVAGAPEAFAGFGSAVTTGDFDGDGSAELAVGATNGRTGGTVQTLERGAAGYRGPEPIGPRTSDLPGDVPAYCAFGFVLASGDVHGDGRDDLTVADPGYGCREELSVEFGKGAVMLLPGSPTGLTPKGSQLWTQDSPGVAGTARLGNVFGEALAIGPLDRGSTDDLAIGAPGDLAGSVTLLLGAVDGLTTAGSGGSRYAQDTPGIPGTNEPEDSFGETLTAAYAQSRTQASLVIGTPGESVGSLDGAGAASQLSIRPAGPDPVRSQTFTADTPGVQGVARKQESFGGGTRRWG